LEIQMEVSLEILLLQLEVYLEILLLQLVVSLEIRLLQQVDHCLVPEHLYLEDKTVCLNLLLTKVLIRRKVKAKMMEMMIMLVKEETVHQHINLTV